MQIKTVAVAGAGLAGRLLIRELVRRGLKVDAYDPAPDPGEPSQSFGDAPRAAGWTAAGMLSPVAELESGDADVYRLGVRSLELWPQIVATLPKRVYHRQIGSLMLAHRGDEGAASRMTDLLAYKLTHGTLADEGRDLPALMHRITLDELGELEPSVHGPAQAWLLPGEGQIHTREAMLALAADATANGVRWHWGEHVQSVSPGRLETSNGAAIEADWVFDARGLGARPQLPTRGVRGEVIWLHAPEVVLHRPLRLLHPRHRVYIVPRPGNIIFIGASEIESEDRGPVSLRSAVELMAAAHSVLPELAEARIVHMETNLRPALPDNLPRVDTETGMTRVNGLFRHGWMIAPALVERALAEFDGAGH